MSIMSIMNVVLCCYCYVYFIDELCLCDIYKLFFSTQTKINNIKIIN